jgi:S-formylglutathione hydrolase FrmB
VAAPLPVVSRRGLLGAAAVGAVAALAGCSGTSHASRPTGASSKGATGVRRTTYTLRSAARLGRTISYDVVLPPGHDALDGLPVCLALHGRGDDHRSAVDLLHLDRALATVVAAGGTPFAIVAPDGGDHTYWHRRADGDDPQAMLTDELLPVLKGRGARTDRFALFGWSMGGYGALLLAEKLGAARIAFVAADAPALWLEPGLSAAGAFDDADDFVRNDVYPGRARLAGIPVRVVCGASDPFNAADRVFVQGVPDLVGVDYPPGGHDAKVWAATAVAQLTPLARALSMPASG